MRADLGNKCAGREWSTPRRAADNVREAGAGYPDAVDPVY